MMEQHSLKEKVNSGNAKEYTLSIRLMPDGFSFSIHNFLEENSFYYEKILFPCGTPYLTALEEAVLHNETLLFSYRKVQIVVATSRFTLVPSDLFVSSDSDSIYHFSQDYRKERILEDKIDQCGLCNLYGIDPDVYAFLLRTFQSLNFHHHLSVLITYFSTRSKMGNSAKMICQLRDQVLDVLCFRKGKLLLCNSFQTNHIQDSLYFIMKCWKSAGLHEQTDTLQLTADPQMLRELQQLFSPYLANVEPILFPTQFFTMGKESINSPFDLIALELCV